MDQFVLVAGSHDLLAISGSRYIFAAARWSPVDLPIRGAYRSYGGIEFDVESMINDNGFSLHYAGLSGDIPIAEVAQIRSGLKYDFNNDYFVPALGFGLDNGMYSLDYGVLLRLDDKIFQQHSIGLRIRL